MYSNIDMISSLCILMARGAVISMAVVVLILPSMFMVFDRVIVKTSRGFLPGKEGDDPLSIVQCRIRSKYVEFKKAGGSKI